VSRPPIEKSMSPSFRPTRAKESIATEGRPSCPRYLSKPERQRFRQICKELELRKCLTKGDGELISLTVTTWMRWREAMSHVEKEGAVVISISKGKDGELIEREKKNVWLTLAQEAEKTLLACYDRLGFTPMNRERAKPVQKPKPEEPPKDELDLLRESCGLPTSITFPGKGIIQ
jgi:P27 family predicted phage terminase small subunit